MSRISYLSELLSSVFVRREIDAQPQDHRTMLELCDALLAHNGERTGSQIARGLLTRFSESSYTEQLAFFHLLADQFDIEAEAALQAAQEYVSDKSAQNLSNLMARVEPKRQELFRRLNCVPGATNQLVKMRALLLNACQTYPELRRIDLDFIQLFRGWFNPGFLVLREIGWHTSANVLEKIIEHGEVHGINSWRALRDRLEPDDRRCFAFFHPAMLDEPIVFVEVALTRSLPQTIHELIEPERSFVSAASANTAVLYSYSNCQKGLSGVSFGNSLIKQVATELAIELPALDTFVTLSHVPGFMPWVREQLSRVSDNNSSTFAADDAVYIPQVAGMRLAAAIAQCERYDFDESDKLQLQQLVAHYLLQAKRTDNQPADPVARFHLRNGAILDSVLPCADLHERGLGLSAGVMVSYRYDLKLVDDNHEAYAAEQRVIASDAVRELCDPPGRARKRA